MSAPLEPDAPIEIVPAGNSPPADVSSPGLPHVPVIVEIFVACCLGVFPDLLNATLYPFNGATSYGSGSNSFQLSLMARSLQVSAPLLLLMYVSRVNWADHGFRRWRMRRDSIALLGLVSTVYIAYYSLYLLVPELWTQAYSVELQPLVPGRMPAWSVTSAIVVTSLANGFAEELMMRAYLIPRFEICLRSTVGAVVVTSGLFASYHLYQGPAGVISIFICGLIFGGYFAYTRRLWPIAGAHAFMNFVPLIASQYGSY